MAEEAAVVDLISAGRLDLGLGSGYRVPEFQLFGADLASRYTTTVDRVRELRRLWDQRVVTPLPVQERIPIWLGFQGPKGARRAGLLGEGLLSADARLWEPYRDALTEGGHPIDRGKMAGVIQAFVTDDPEEDWPVVKEHIAYQLDSYRQYLVEGTGAPQPRPVDPETVRSRRIGGTLGYFAHATPEEIAARIVEYTAGAPVETVFIFVSVGGMPEAIVARHLRTICTRLQPLLADV
jgi:alkanesulfonate monooxygenase SsuD/methylene tetrahydromethanopterin reductase-like flavin-dependent oxidoreductase (luciferase family)